MIQAIVYSSNTGFTAQYAAMLAEKTGLPAYALADAAGQVADGGDILYLGWLMASKVNGYAKAAKKYRVAALCGVGMGASGTQIPEIRKAEALPETMPVFTVQGGFDMKKLHGVYKLMMLVMKNTAGKSLAKKQNRTPDEDDMLDLLLNGGSRVKEENLADMLAWFHAQ